MPDGINEQTMHDRPPGATQGAAASSSDDCSMLENSNGDNEKARRSLVTEAGIARQITCRLLSPKGGFASRPNFWLADSCLHFILINCLNGVQVPPVWFHIAGRVPQRAHVALKVEGETDAGMPSGNIFYQFASYPPAMSVVV